jgi:hypothetical protein
LLQTWYFCNLVFNVCILGRKGRAKCQIQIGNNPLKQPTIMTCSVWECFVNGPPLPMVSWGKRFSRLGGDERGSMIGESNGRSGISVGWGRTSELAGAVVDPFL